MMKIGIKNAKKPSSFCRQRFTHIQFLSIFFPRNPFANCHVCSKRTAMSQFKENGGLVCRFSVCNNCLNVVYS